MPVNGFSFLSANFLFFIVLQHPVKVLALKSAWRKSGNAVLGRAFDPIRDRAYAGVMPGSGFRRNFAPRGRNRTNKPTPHGGSAEFRALSANHRREKIARCSRYR